MAVSMRRRLLDRQALLDVQSWLFRQRRLYGHHRHHLYCMFGGRPRLRELDLCVLCLRFLPRWLHRHGSLPWRQLLSGYNRRAQLQLRAILPRGIACPTLVFGRLLLPQYHCANTMRQRLVLRPRRDHVSAVPCRLALPGWHPADVPRRLVLRCRHDGVLAVRRRHILGLERDHVSAMQRRLVLRRRLDCLRELPRRLFFRRRSRSMRCECGLLRSGQEPAGVLHI